MKTEQPHAKNFDLGRTPAPPRKNGRPKKRLGALKARDTKKVLGALLPLQTVRPLTLTERILGEETDYGPIPTLYTPATHHVANPVTSSIAAATTPATTPELSPAKPSRGQILIRDDGKTPPPEPPRLSANGKYLIEPGIPIPPIRSAAHRTRPMREIAVGQSFFIATKVGKTPTKVNNKVRGLEGRRFISRHWVEDGVEGRRIWRIK